jgi:sugar/nucleoside kinase (ribokinase family)
MVYAKPFLTGNEESRFDFGTFNAMTVDLEDCLIASLAATAATSDVVVLNQQIPNGITGRALVERINGVIAAYPEVPFVVDARHIADAYRAAVLKLNIAEACRYLGVPFHHAIGRSEALDYAGEIHLRTGKPAFITRGAGGIVVAADGDVVSVPGLRIHGPVDTVGAGDTVAAALAAALGSGQSARQAAELANVAAMITVQKLGTTGTASPQEIADAAENLEYVAEV